MFRRIEEAIEWADVLNVLRLQLERMKAGFIPSLREYNRVFGVTARAAGARAEDVLILHPGPMNRGVEIDSDVADGPHSVILHQVTNGVAVRMAVLYLLAGGRRDGRGGEGRGTMSTLMLITRRARGRSRRRARRRRSTCCCGDGDRRVAARRRRPTSARAPSRSTAPGSSSRPGFIDVHVPPARAGRRAQETIATGARAAAAGGFTAVCAMPNTDPVTDNQARRRLRQRQAQRAARRASTRSAASRVGQKGEQLAEFGEMVGRRRGRA